MARHMQSGMGKRRRARRRARQQAGTQGGQNAPRALQTFPHGKPPGMGNPPGTGGGGLRVKAPGCRPGQCHPDRAHFARQAIGIEPLSLEIDD
jgi:hypothetical protein